ncbi:PepSY domain-containing protein [uncultured Thiohalocapsa sp.]|uniref:PepSY domain-containing protein n=1 Tax=uncultured Thiohalocapsa sp. TaxID=768990 RepID=UPI0025DAAC14|nr:PepSY domain-containing protein [uncultured Thiohalocapsa sp.]
MHTRPSVATAVITLFCCPPLAQADSDADRARRLAQEGAILTLEEILPLLREARPGTLIELELEYEREHGTYVYEMEVLDADGRLWEVELDASTGALIEVELDD